MATATKITGESFGYRVSDSVKMLNGTKFISALLTPQDADLHDISKEGLLFSVASWRVDFTALANRSFFFAMFNRTSNVAPKANNSAASWRDSQQTVMAGAAYYGQDKAIERNLAILPGGGVPLIADFITLSFEADANMTADIDIYYELYYKWIPINSDDYRKILYARSI
jgi:hypothetical protein